MFNSGSNSTLNTRSLQTLHPSTPPAPLFSDWAAVAQAVEQVIY